MFQEKEMTKRLKAHVCLMCFRNSKQLSVWSTVKDRDVRGCEDWGPGVRSEDYVGPINPEGQEIMPGSILRHSTKPHLAPILQNSTEPCGILTSEGRMFTELGTFNILGH